MLPALSANAHVVTICKLGAELLARSFPLRRPVGWDQVYAEPAPAAITSINQPVLARHTKALSGVP